MKIKAGIIAAVPNAAMLSQAVPVEVTKDVETTGIVLSPVCVSTVSYTHLTLPTKA